MKELMDFITAVGTTVTAVCVLYMVAPKLFGCFKRIF